MNKILFISAFPPSNKTAGQNYTCQLLNDLSKDYKIDMIYWSYAGHKAIVPEEVNIREEIVLTKVQKVFNAIKAFIFFPLFTVRFDWRVCRQIKKIALDYDILYYDFSQIFLYSLFIRHPLKVFMCHDVISQKYSRKRLSSLYLWLVKLTESLLLKTAHLRLCFSAKDVTYIMREFCLSAQKVSFYISDQIRCTNQLNYEVGNYFVLFGAWNRPENYEGLLWFCEKVLPHCDISCVVIGGGMSEDVKRKAECDKLKCVGFVDNPYTLIASSVALIAPIFQGAGVKVKVVESLALGIPIIGTDIAFEGIDNIEYSINKQALILANNAYEFIQKIKEFEFPSIVEKESIRTSFMRNYQCNSFRSILEAIETGRN